MTHGVRVTSAQQQPTHLKTCSLGVPITSARGASIERSGSARGASIERPWSARGATIERPRSERMERSMSAQRGPVVPPTELPSVIGTTTIQPHSISAHVSTRRAISCYHSVPFRAGMLCEQHIPPIELYMHL